MIINRQDYLDKVLGCWMGKNIGGTLGAPMEWERQINDVSFYTQDLHGEPLPNDDLDIQLLWLIAMEEKGVNIDAHTLAEYWCMYVAPHWAEYGTGKINMRAGLLPPVCGTFKNDYKDSCGSFIRSEIWACITPGLPHLAARYAYEDAILDHGDGEGTYSEVFCAVLESAAFVISDLRALVDIGLSYIPKDCGTAMAVQCAVDCFDKKMKWQDARDEILRHHRGSTFMGLANRTSPDDHKKGFADGKQGYDAPSNVAITVYGLLYGGDDFNKMICTTVNCGEDTDCTGATAGSVYGIMHGIDGIPEKWIKPIGRGIKTIALNQGDLWGNQLIPPTIDNLTERTATLAAKVLIQQRNPTLCISEDQPTDLSDANPNKLHSEDQGREFYTAMDGPRFDFDFFTVDVHYGDNPLVRNNEPKKVQLTIHNRYRAQANLSLHWYTPEGWTISPAPDGALLSLPPNIGKPLLLEFSLQAETVTKSMNRFVVELTIEGRPTVMLVPITLMNGNLEPAELE